MVTRHPPGVWSGLVTGRAAGERGWGVRAACLLAALGLVLMHHVIGAHQHQAADPPAPVGAASAVQPSAAPTALLHVHHGDGDDAAAMLEDVCLGLLAASVVLIAVMVFLGVPRPGAGAGAGRRIPRDVPARGPPLPRRLSQLQVLRV